ncbi:MAG: NADP-dependent oxidoreductase [Hyphomonadaceae bacterium]|nr:NADP-dependent oxidoreductase [Hyphomonadaceae bacterium]
MSARENTQITLARRPVGFLGPENFAVRRGPAPTIGAGEALVELHYISLDPAMRGWIDDHESYLPPVEIGEVMRAGGIGQVIASKADELKEGDWVTGLLGVQNFAVIRPGAAQIVPVGAIPAHHFLGELGIPGLTAYYGMLDIGAPVAGETVFVSAASGPVGAVAGQIAKLKGCRVVGTASSDAKVAFIKELGFDDAFKYEYGRLSAQLKAACPDGVDIYFDNVGGDMLEAAIGAMKNGGRIVSCGMISTYNDTAPRPGPHNMSLFIIRRLRMQGFVVLDYFNRQAEFVGQMVEWVRDGKVRCQYDIVEGLENFPQALTKLFRSENFGKLLIKSV